MKKVNRLLKNKDFKSVLDNKKSVANKGYIIYIKKNKFNHLRVGISVSSKLGNSVIRHKIKRQINEMLKSILDVNESYDLVLFAHTLYKDQVNLFNELKNNK